MTSSIIPMSAAFISARSSGCSAGASTLLAEGVVGSTLRFAHPTCLIDFHEIAQLADSRVDSFQKSG